MDKGYTLTIGLEIHAELKTKTKMFCDSKNEPHAARPNTNICPVCMAHPGTLPVINKEAVRHVLKVGTALGSKLADFTEFDRKNYFYPDIPKGYQISQYKYPLVSGGTLAGAEITRVHLEEDTARSTHHTGHSLVDFNRAGVPLMELVTEPVVKDAEHAVRFAKEFQLLLRYLGVSDANMEKGEMRVEANISVSKTKTFGTKVEVKNLNSFKAVERAIRYETERQIKVLESGGEVDQETRGWDENKDETFSQRKKESADDYRYFPDPDLPKLKISEIPEFSREVLEQELPELPWVKRERYLALGISSSNTEFLLGHMLLGPLFDALIKKIDEEHEGDTKLKELSSNYISSDLAGLLKSDGRSDGMNVGVADFLKLMVMNKEKITSSRNTKDILRIMYEKGGNPEIIAEENGLLQKSDEGELKKVVEKIIAENKDVALEYRGGKDNALQFLIGQGMKETKGSANPQILKELFTSILS